MTSVKNVTSYSKMFISSLKVFKLLSSLSRKKYDRDNFTHTPCKRLQGQNTLVGIGLIELTEPSDTLNYKSFFKHCILQTTLHVFSLLIFVWNKIFCCKN